MRNQQERTCSSIHTTQGHHESCEHHQHHHFRHQRKRARAGSIEGKKLGLRRNKIRKKNNKRKKEKELVAWSQNLPP